LLAALIAIRIADPGPVVRLRLLAFDTFQRLNPRPYNPDLPVRIVDIDEASLKRFGQWPWPRALLAELVRKLGADGAAAVSFDIIMAEPERPVADDLLKRLPKDEGVEQLLDRVRQLPSGDSELAKAIGEAPVVLGFIGSNRAGPPPEPRASFAAAGDDPGQFLPAFTGAAASLPELEEHARGAASLNWVPEQDQIIRRLPTLVKVGGKLFPSLAADSLRVAQGASTIIVKSSNASGEEAFGAKTGIVALRIGDVEVPTDGSGQLWIRFTRSDQRRFIPAADFLEGKVDRSEIEGRIILIGTSAAGLFDLRTTPLDAAVPGVEVHAQAIEQMMHGEHLRRPDFAAGAEIAFLAIVGMLIALAVYATGALVSAVLGATAILGAVASSWAAYRGFGWLFDPIYPAAALSLLYISTTVYLYLRTEGERRRVRNAFNHYMAPELVEQLSANPDKLKLGGEIREVTLLFCDVRGFTSISEKLTAEELTAFLNRLLTPLSDTILANRGYIDKYMGDAIMAFWNAPLDDPDHARNACRAALAMLKDVERLNQEWKAEADAAGKPYTPVRIGIGLNTAECCVGNFGSEQRLSYSVIGDGVNIASRLEGRSKDYGVPIVVGEATAALAPEFGLLEVDFVSVKGRAAPLHVSGLMGDPEWGRTEASVALRQAHEAMLSAFRGRRFSEAQAALDEARGLGGPDLDRLYDVYAERIAEYRAAPPPPDWDGRMIAETK
jgi:adenylate cyclase